MVNGELFLAIGDCNDNDDDNDNDDEDDEDVVITVKHIETPSNEITLELDPISEPEHKDDTDPVPAPIPVPVPVPVPVPDTSDEIDMEITKPTEEKQAEEIGEHFGLDTNFDPKLDLSSFRLPPLELLKDYGESSNSVDREELEANKLNNLEEMDNI